MDRAGGALGRRQCSPLTMGTAGTLSCPGGPAPLLHTPFFKEGRKSIDQHFLVQTFKVRAPRIGPPSELLLKGGLGLRSQEC